MAVFSALPQVGAVLLEGDDAAILELFELLQTTLSQRKKEFSTQGISSYRDYVAQQDDCPAILLFIDNYPAFIESYESYEEVLYQLSREAASYGIYLITTMNQAGELRSRMRQNFTTGIALQMTDRFEYEAVIGERTETIPENRIPGRGLIMAPSPVEFQVALCVREDEGRSQVQTLRRQFAGMKPLKEELVKKIGYQLEHLDYNELYQSTEVNNLPDNMLALGLDIKSGLPITINLDEEFCFTVGGAKGAGKTNLLTAVALQAKEKHARVYLFDPKEEILPQQGLFERIVHNDVELFELMDSVIVGEFSNRNTIVADAREAGNDIVMALQDYERIVFIINDMSAFILAVYSKNIDMSGFLELALNKGVNHKILFVAAVTPEDATDMARYAVMRTFVSFHRGVHLGGMFDQQTILQFKLSAADYVRQLEPGVGYAVKDGDIGVQFMTPYVKEDLL
jgi:S-DNA-T family DNA segregation ATPase FtsK/SpoIIIE